jgi:hypothetical protein
MRCLFFCASVFKISGDKRIYSCQNCGTDQFLGAFSYCQKCGTYMKDPTKKRGRSRTVEIRGRKSTDDLSPRQNSSEEDAIETRTQTSKTRLVPLKIKHAPPGQNNYKRPIEEPARKPRRTSAILLNYVAAKANRDAYKVSNADKRDKFDTKDLKRMARSAHNRRKSSFGILLDKGTIPLFTISSVCLMVVLCASNISIKICDKTKNPKGQRSKSETRGCASWRTCSA